MHGAALAERAPLKGADIVLSLLTGRRTEELRALLRDDVHLQRENMGDLEIPPHVAVWRSVRVGGDTKTKKSRRTLALPQRCVVALQWQAVQQHKDRELAGDRWHEHGLVCASRVGTPLDASHVRRDFRLAIKNAPGIDPTEWTPRELRHNFVSLLSDHGMPLEDISRLAGHSSTAVTEAVYRKQTRPVFQAGATCRAGPPSPEPTSSTAIPGSSRRPDSTYRRLRYRRCGTGRVSLAAVALEQRGRLRQSRSFVATRSVSA